MLQAETFLTEARKKAEEANSKPNIEQISKNTMYNQDAIKEYIKESILDYITKKDTLSSTREISNVRFIQENEIKKLVEELIEEDKVKEISDAGNTYYCLNNEKNRLKREI
jgi:hypothetical protein